MSWSCAARPTTCIPAGSGALTFGNPTGIDIDAFTLTIRLRRLAMLLDEGVVKRGEAAGVKLNEVLLLLALRRMAPTYSLRPTDILKMHSVTSGTVTYRIDQLIKQDLAERIPDPDDKRGYLIRLTQRGRAVVDKVMLGAQAGTVVDLVHHY